MRGLPQLSLLLTAHALFVSAVLPDRAESQLPDSVHVPPITQEGDSSPEEVQPEGISPRGAFIRSSLVPGWGHAEVGAFVRGAFYFTTEAATAFMVFKTQTRIIRTRSRLEMREAVVTARLEAEGITDPGEIEGALAQDPEIEDLRALEETRAGQREDWIALGLFFMLIGGVDAYVSAHLADFPVALVIEPTPAGGVEIGLSLPVGF
jgi:hypothetical protein